MIDSTILFFSGFLLLVFCFWCYRRAAITSLAMDMHTRAEIQQLPFLLWEAQF